MHHHPSFDTRSGRRSAMFRHSLDRSRCQLSACVLETEKMGGEREHEESHAALAVSDCFLFIYFRPPLLGGLEELEMALPRAPVAPMPLLVVLACPSVSIVALSDLLDGPESEEHRERERRISLLSSRGGEQRKRAAAFFFSSKTSSTSRPTSSLSL